MRYSIAYGHCKRAVRLSPDNTTYLNKAGLVADTLGDYDKAIEYYEEKGTLKGFKGAHGMTKGQIIRMATQSDGSILAAARAAIKNGAPKDAVIKRLIENGLNPEDL